MHAGMAQQLQRIHARDFTNHCWESAPIRAHRVDPRI